jgi:ADP-ribosylglycohydrolase
MERAKAMVYGSFIGDSLALGVHYRYNVKAIAELGQACSVEHGVPSVMHLMACYEEDIKEALVASVMAGGDSAARNHAVGMILGAYNGIDDLPEKCFNALKAKNRIDELLEQSK